MGIKDKIAAKRDEIKDGIKAGNEHYAELKKTNPELFKRKKS